MVVTGTWHSTNPPVLLHYLALLGAIGVLTAIAWSVLQRSFLVIYGGAWLLAWCYFSGLGPVAAVSLLLLAATAAGSLVLPVGLPARLPLACVAGLGMIAALCGWLLPFHVHRSGTYFMLLSLLVVMRGRFIIGMVRQVLNEATGLRPETGGTAVAAFLSITVIGLASTCTWLPTLQSDDLSYHLAMPWQLQQLGYYRMDAATSIWAMAPWSGDVLHAIAQVLAGQESRGALNGAWFMLCLSLMWRVAAQLELSPAVRWLALALYASLPMSASLLAGMQTETATTVVLLALAVMILDQRPRDGRWLLLLATLAALLISLKLSNVLMLLPFGIAVVFGPGDRLPWRHLPLALLYGLVLAGSSYAYAYLVTDNPVLPFLNGFFHSPYFIQENWKDGMWMSGFDWRAPWDITFHTTRYLNASDGAAGITGLVVLAGLGLAIFRPRARMLSLIVIAAFLLVFWQIQYLRYVHPVMVLAIPAALAGLAWAAGRGTSWQLATWLTVVGNVALITTGYWQLNKDVLNVTVKQGKEAAYARFAPQRTIAAFLRQQLPDSFVLFHSVVSHGNAELPGRGFTDAWYDSELVAAAGKAEADDSGQTWRALLSKFGFDVVVAPRSSLSTGLQAALHDLDGKMVFGTDSYQAWTVSTASSIPSSAYVDDKYTKTTFKSPAPVRTINIEAVLTCDQTDKPIVMSLTRREPGDKTDTFIRSEWVICDADGRANYRSHYTFHNPSNQFSVTAVPKDDMKFALVSIKATARSEFARNRDAARALRQRLGERWARRFRHE